MPAVGQPVLDLLMNLGTAIASSVHFEEALCAVFGQICQETLWPVAEAWVPVAEGTQLALSPVGYCGSKEAVSFREARRDERYPPGIGLPGRVWQLREAIWVSDLSASGDLDDFGDAARWKAAFGLPVLAGREVIAVLVFFLGQPRERDEHMLRFTSILASQLGGLVERNRLEALVLEASEREQRRIGQDIHDGLSQQLSSVAYLGHLLLKKLRARALPEAAEAARIIELVTEASEQARAVARGLSPVPSHPSGLMVALHELARSVERTYGLGCWFVCEPNLRLGDERTATHLYRVAQEAVHNAVKHSHADEIVIDLQQNNGRLELRIEDNGRGLPGEAPRRGGMGLDSMRSRARAIGGRLALESRSDHGTRLVCSLPFPPPRAESSR